MKNLDIFSIVSFQKIGFVLLATGPAAAAYSLTYFLRHHEPIFGCLMVFLLGTIGFVFGLAGYLRMKKFVFLRTDNRMKKVLEIMTFIFPIFGAAVGIGVNFLN